MSSVSGDIHSISIQTSRRMVTKTAVVKSFFFFFTPFMPHAHITHHNKPADKSQPLRALRRLEIFSLNYSEARPFYHGGVFWVTHRTLWRRASSRLSRYVSPTRPADDDDDPSMWINQANLIRGFTSAAVHLCMYNLYLLICLVSFAHKITVQMH